MTTPLKFETMSGRRYEIQTEPEAFKPLSPKRRPSPSEAEDLADIFIPDYGPNIRENLPSRALGVHDGGYLLEALASGGHINGRRIFAFDLVPGRDVNYDINVLEANAPEDIEPGRLATSTPFGDAAVLAQVMDVRPEDLVEALGAVIGRDLSEPFVGAERKMAEMSARELAIGTCGCDECKKARSEAAETGEPLARAKDKAEEKANAELAKRRAADQERFEAFLETLDTKQRFSVVGLLASAAASESPMASTSAMIVIQTLMLTQQGMPASEASVEALRYVLEGSGASSSAIKDLLENEPEKVKTMSEAAARSAEAFFSVSPSKAQNEEPKSAGGGKANVDLTNVIPMGRA